MLLPRELLWGAAVRPQVDAVRHALMTNSADRPHLPSIIARLDEVCVLLGLPGKLGVDGSLVEGMYEEGRIEEIRDDCELDVLNTYLVYLRGPRC